MAVLLQGEIVPRLASKFLHGVVGHLFGNPLPHHDHTVGAKNEVLEGNDMPGKFVVIRAARNEIAVCVAPYDQIIVLNACHGGQCGGVPSWVEEGSATVTEDQFHSFLVADWRVKACVRSCFFPPGCPGHIVHKSMELFLPFRNFFFWPMQPGALTRPWRAIDGLKAFCSEFAGSWQ